ncbi:hypothetical protein ScPMuIL_016846 [Solemya velum]
MASGLSKSYVLSTVKPPASSASTIVNDPTMRFTEGRVPIQQTPDTSEDNDPTTQPLERPVLMSPSTPQTEAHRRVY